MKPFDPRLLRYAHGVRPLLTFAVLAGVASVVAVIAQAALLAGILSSVIIDGAGLPEVSSELGWLLLVVLIRGAISAAAERVTGSMAHGIIARMRRELLTHLSRLGTRRPVGQQSASMATLAGPGLDSVQTYLTGYLPQLVLAALVPASMVAVLASQDLISAGIVAVTLPLIPLFMALVGWYTNRRAAVKWHALQRLSNHFLDVVAGLPTLKVFGRAQGQAARVGEVTDRYRRTTMGTLRIAFLSSLVLELLATLSVALVAVTMGVRLVHGSVGLQVGLMVLILAPEAYFPLRALGTRFHAAADGVAAVDQALAVLELPVPSNGHSVMPIDISRVELRGAGVNYEGRGGVSPVDLVLEPGQITALIGPSGVGKSTVLAMLAGLVTPDRGEVLVGSPSRPLAEFDGDLWRGRIAVATQSTFLIAGTIRDNLLLGNESATDSVIRQALLDVDAGFVFDLRDGWHTPLTDDGAGLSSGQRQRLVLARTLVRVVTADAALVLLDEPTATLDASTEARVLVGLQRALRGRTVLLVTHRSAALAVADRVYGLTSAGCVLVENAVTAEHFKAPASADLMFAELTAEHGSTGHAAAQLPPARPAAARPIRRILTLTRPERSRLLVAAALGALATACAVALMAVSAWLISRAAQHPPILTLMVAVVGVRTFGLGRGILRYTERLVSHDAALRVLARVRVAVLDRLVAVAPTGLPVWRRSDLLARLINDVDDIQDLLLRGLLPMVGAALVCGTTVGVLVLILPSVGLAVAVALLIAAVVVPWWLHRQGLMTEAQAVRARSERAVLLTDTVAHLDELQLVGGLDAVWPQLRKLETTAAVVARRRGQEAGTASAAAVLAGGLGSWLALIIGIPVVGDGSLPAVMLAVLVLTPLALIETLNATASAATALAAASASAGRVLEILGLSDPLVRNGSGSQAIDPTRPVIELRGISARWPGATRDAITDIDLTIKPGDRIGILGPSGSGKSTLLAVLLGFLPPTAGEIRVNGVSVDQLDPDQLSALFSWTGQDSHLFATSMAENLRLGKPDATPADMGSALVAAGWPSWMEAVPGGLDSEVGERGAALSGGERQRLLMARALLADRPVLLADEPTAHLDPSTADALIDQLMTENASRATILVTHREQDTTRCTSVLRLFDSELVLNR